MRVSPPDSKRTPASSLLAAAWQGARFGARFTFWFLVVLVSLPVASFAVIRAIERPWAIGYLFQTPEGLVRFVMPVVGVPLAGAVLGAAVAAVLLPAASLLNGRSSSGRWEEYESPSPFADMPAPRSREELLRRIVIDAPHDLAKQS